MCKLSNPITELALISSDPAAMEAQADPGQFVVMACERAKEWLSEALEHGEIEKIVEIKSQAEAIRVYTAQKQIGKDAELSAAEIVRRAERGLGLAVKRGQLNGLVNTATGNRYRRAGGGLPSPRSFFSCKAEHEESYVLAGSSEEKFEKAVQESKEEKNLSRSNEPEVRWTKANCERRRWYEY